jgi:hypothetical protein
MDLSPLVNTDIKTICERALACHLINKIDLQLFMGRWAIYARNKLGAWRRSPSLTPYCRSTRRMTDDTKIY